MGHHLDDQGRFQSDKHDLPPDRVRINISLPRNWPGLLLIADAYQEIDREFAEDLRERIRALSATREMLREGEPPTCCYRDCGLKAAHTFFHEGYTHACIDHVESLRPWIPA